MAESERKRTSKKSKSHLFASSFEPIDHVGGVFLVSRAYDGVALDGVLGERAIEKFRLFRVPSRNLRVFQQKDGTSVVRLTKGYRARRLVPQTFASYGGGEISPRFAFKHDERFFIFANHLKVSDVERPNFGIGKAFAETRGFASVDEEFDAHFLAKKDRFKSRDMRFAHLLK
jgi:hypothetical protein